MFGFIWRWDLAVWLYAQIIGFAYMIIMIILALTILYMAENPDSNLTQTTLSVAESVFNFGAREIQKHSEKLAHVYGTDNCTNYRKNAWNLTYGPQRTENSQAIALDCEVGGEGVGIPQNNDAAAAAWARENAEMPYFTDLPKDKQRQLIFAAARRLGLPTTDIPGVPSTRGNYTQAYNYAQQSWDKAKSARHAMLVEHWNPPERRKPGIGAGPRDILGK
jgi:hypothetical protein